MSIASKLALDQDQFDDLMLSCWNMRMATLDPTGAINLTPMWFGWAGGRIYTFGRGQKIRNLRRKSVCSIVVDRNERYPELQAATFQGDAVILESKTEEDNDPYLAQIRVQMGNKYSGGRGEKVATQPRAYASTATGRTNRWVVFTPKKQVTWDNHKLPGVKKQK